MPATRRRWTRPLVAALAALLPITGLAAVTLPSATAAAVEGYPVPSTGRWVLDGLGYGHGRGMSQWGAYGAAKLGKTHGGILSAYYPGTTLSSTPTRMLRVWITVDDATLEVVPDTANGLAVTAGTTRLVLPAAVDGTTVTRWRTRQAADGLHLEALTGRSTWTAVPLSGAASIAGPISFTTTAGRVRVVLGRGTGQHLRDYRGSLAAAIDATKTARTVNTVPMEDYLRSVVAWEMSASWPAEALRAQAIAARTYATWDAATPGSVSDTCDSTACQAYRGMADYSMTGARTGTYEWAGSDAAVSSTAGQILTYAGRPAFTQFGAANGGRSVAHPDQVRYPYLPARDDPWDGVVPNTGHAWTATVTAAAVQKAWPGIGTVTGLRVLARSGAGTWGGRVTSVGIDGSSGSTTVPGDTFRAKLGLRSTWWRPQPTATPTPPPTPTATAPLGPSAPRSLSAKVAAGVATLSWAVPASPGSAPVTGYTTVVGSARARSTGTSVTLPRLLPGSYPVTVTATSRVGTSPALTGRVVVPAYPTVTAPARVTSGANAAVTLSGLAPGAPATVATLPYGAATWAAGPTATASSTGTAVVTLRVRVTSSLRVASGGVTSPARTITATVAPRLTATSPAAGQVRVSVVLTPNLAGIPVQILRVNADGSRTLLVTPRTAAGTGIAAATFGRQRSGAVLRLVAVPQAGPQRLGLAGAPATVRVR